MRVHLLDGAYELFRHFFGQPPRAADDGTEIGATYGVVTSVLLMLAGGVTHLGVATDHVIESFRNDLWPGYKTGGAVPHKLLAQFPLLEEAVRARYGIGPGSIPDWLALVGDSADGFPGVAGWGKQSASAILARFEHL